MPFHLTSDQELIQKTVRELAETLRGKPAEHVDRSREFPKDGVQKLAQLGLTVMLVPAEKGGAGTDTVSYALALEETAKASGTLALVLNNLNALGTYPVAVHAQDAVRDEVLPQALTGESFIAWALTEPQAGSDVGNLGTRVKKDGDEYVLNGVKSFVVGAPHAKWFVVFASGAEGVSAFLVPADAAGLRVAPPERMMSFRGSEMAQVFLNDVRVPATHLVGQEGKGLEMAEECLQLARLGGAAIAVGLMDASYEDSKEYSGSREQFRTPLKRFQAIQWQIVDMEVQLRTARLLTYAAADKRDRGEDWSLDLAAAKLYAADVAKPLTQKAIRIHGGTGFMRDLPIERNNRDARALSIYAGSSEMQRAQIAARVLDL